jgi:hypothetical protein
VIRARLLRAGKKPSPLAAAIGKTEAEAGERFKVDPQAENNRGGDRGNQHTGGKLADDRVPNATQTERSHTGPAAVGNKQESVEGLGPGFRIEG